MACIETLYLVCLVLVAVESKDEAKVCTFAILCCVFCGSSCHVNTNVISAPDSKCPPAPLIIWRASPRSYCSLKYGIVHTKFCQNRSGALKVEVDIEHSDLKTTVVPFLGMWVGKTYSDYFLKKH
jgi:hypothetical protein